MKIQDLLEQLTTKFDLNDTELNLYVRINDDVYDVMKIEYSVTDNCVYLKI